MTSGRAGWHAILQTIRPRRVHLPFYICDAAIAPLNATGTPYEFYPIDPRLCPPPDLAVDDGDVLLVVNYFGLLGRLVDDLARALGRRVVVDDTQAFFREGAAGGWSFNSARKFFGVPDGAYVYGPLSIGALPPSDLTDCDHLITRLEGEDARAWDQFKRHEARIGIEPRAMARLSSRLLGAIDMLRAQEIRRANFAALQMRLGSINRLELALDTAAVDAGPMCYPFLADRSVDRTLLAEHGVFVPMLWPELASRPGAAFDWERELACRLLPLPIDHRYTAADMDTVADRLLQVLA